MSSRGPALAGSLLAVLALVAAAPLEAAPFRAESRLEPRVAGLGERIRFTIQVQGPGFEQPRLRPRFELDNLEIVAGPDSSHGIAVGGPAGASGWHYSWSWWLAPRAVGPAAVRDIYLLVGEQEVELPERAAEIVREPVAGSRRPAAEPPARSAIEELMRRTRERFRGGLGPLREDDRRPDVFLQAVATPVRPYVGQRVVYTVYLFHRVPVRAVDAESLPSFEGLWARPVELSPAPGEQVEHDGALYLRVPVYSKELFALGVRSHRVEPLRARVVVDRIERDRLFSAPVRVPSELVAESNPLVLDVRPLPAPVDGAAEGFSGVVGRLVLGAELAPETVAVGRGATLTVTASGDGYLEALPAPRLALPPGIDLVGPRPVPPPQSDGEVSARSWRYLLVPRRPGAYRLAAVELPYFDPQEGEYRLARVQPPRLVARPESAAEASVSAPPRPIRSAAFPLPPEPVWRGALPWAFALPWAAALVLILARRSGGAAPGAGALAGLPGFSSRLRSALAEERPRAVANAIERAWRTLLTEALGVPVQVPSASWADELLERGVEPDDCQALRDVLEDIHYLRFAPELSAAAALAAELVARSERLARGMVRG